MSVCVWDSSERRALHNVLGRGSIGWTSRFLMLQKLPIMAEVWPDIHNRRWNTTLTSFHQAGVTMVKLDIQLAFNFAKGPWNKNLNFNKLVESAHEYSTGFDSSDSIFQHMYSWIVEDRHSFRMPAAFGSPQQMVSVFKALPEASVINRKGSKTKMNRWFDWVKKAACLKEE